MANLYTYSTSSILELCRKLLCVIHSRNARHDRREKRRMEGLTKGLFSVGFNSYVPISVPFQTRNIEFAWHQV